MWQQNRVRIRITPMAVSQQAVRAVRQGPQRSSLCKGPAWKQLLSRVTNHRHALNTSQPGIPNGIWTKIFFFLNTLLFMWVYLCYVISLKSRAWRTEPSRVLTETGCKSSISLLSINSADKVVQTAMKLLGPMVTKQHTCNQYFHSLTSGQCQEL